jgi:hypothetical protein
MTRDDTDHISTAKIVKHKAAVAGL